MITIRRSSDRGHAEHGWLSSRHTFSFADYQDPKHMGFSTLRVINEDHVQPGKGFAEHGHNDMEIITYVLAGALEHKDSLGNGSIIKPGDVQRMSAGTGVRHSEFNASQTEPVHLLQIWILPKEQSMSPGYEQKHFADESKQNKLLLIGSADGRDGSVTIHQDVNLYASILGAGHTLDFDITEGRKVWLQLARGELAINDEQLQAGDSAAIDEPGPMTLSSPSSAKFLLFDLA